MNPKCSRSRIALTSRCGGSCRRRCHRTRCKHSRSQVHRLRQVTAGQGLTKSAPWFLLSCPPSFYSILRVRSTNHISARLILSGNMEHTTWRCSWKPRSTGRRMPGASASAPSRPADNRFGPGAGKPIVPSTPSTGGGPSSFVRILIYIRQYNAAQPWLAQQAVPSAKQVGRGVQASASRRPARDASVAPEA